MKLRTVLSAAAALLALSLPPHSAQALTLNPKASAIATLIAGAPVTALCGDTEPEWLAQPDVAYWEARDVHPNGLALIDQRTILLAPQVCVDLNRRGPLAGGAALTVTHEAVHVALASYDEALVECVAGQNVWSAVHALHLPRKLERVAYAEALAEHNDLANDPTGTYNWRGRC